MSTFILWQRLEAEAASLRQLLELASVDDVLGRFSLQNRLNEVQRELDQIAGERGTRAEIALVFNGRPVSGARAIDATFGSKAIDQFQRTVATAFAVLASDGHVGQRGPTTSAEMAALHITGVVHGSFGFVLEELDPKGDQWTDSALKNASEFAVGYLRRVAADDEAEAEIALEEINDRLFTNIRDFIRLIHDHQATLTIAEHREIFDFDAKSVANAYRRVAEASIQDEELTIQGVLQGVLPGAKRFEFEGGGLRIRGRVARDISEEYLNTLESEPMVGHRVTAVFRKRTVRDTTSAIRESYVLVRVVPDVGAPSHVL